MARSPYSDYAYSELLRRSHPDHGYNAECPACPSVGPIVTIRRITRTGMRRSWTGELLSVGTMHNAAGPMGYVVVMTDYGREIFAMDPTFSTTLEVSA